MSVLIALTTCGGKELYNYKSLIIPHQNDVLIIDSKQYLVTRVIHCINVSPDGEKSLARVIVKVKTTAVVTMDSI